MKKETIFFLQADIAEQINELFKDEKRDLENLLPMADIQHIGGTAIPGMITKKELDIQIRVTEERFDEVIQALRDNLLTPHHIELWKNGFAIFTSWRDRVPVDYLITVIGSDYDHHYKVRDFLIDNPDIKKEYNYLKMKYAGKDYMAYVKAKQEFFGSTNGPPKFLPKAL